MDKEDVVHIYNGISLSQKKKKEILPLAATWMDLEMIILSEGSQKRKTNTIWYHLYVESSKIYIYTKELIYKTETVSQILKSNLELPKVKCGRKW